MSSLKRGLTGSSPPIPRFSQSDRGIAGRNSSSQCLNLEEVETHHLALPATTAG